MPPRPMMQHGPMGQQLPVPSGQHPQTMVPGSFPGQAKPGQPAMPPVGPHGHPMNGGYPAAPGGMAQPATPGLAQRRDSMQFATPTGGAPMVAPSPASAHPAPGPPKLSHHSNFRTETYLPAKVTNRDSYGQVGEFDRTFRDAGIIGAMRPDVPSVLQMGNINIHALTRSIQSGIHGEVRMALDTLATISRCEVPSVYLYISACDDLLEVLMECAEDQLDLLAEHTPEVSDEIQLISYEDLVRGCQVDMLTLRRDPPFASLEYELDRAVERLLCIMTILRNLSFPPVSVTMELHMDQIGRAHQAPNGTHPLGDELVIKFLSDVVRFIGTRTMFLRTNMHTLDFMKDMVIMLSNISGYMEVPGREQAMCLLQFLVAFAPTPIPVASACDDDGIFFAAYDPTMHPYLPAAVDALAKLLARDDPNRLYFNTIFALEATGPTPYDLLTKAFALAVSPIPDQTKSNVRNNLPTIIDARMPSIMQGLLAGDILASLVPGPETGLARVWITSPSGFAQNLNHLVSQLMMMIEARPRQPPARSAPRGDQELPETLLAIRRALSMQKSLLDKSRDPYDPEGSLPAGVAPPTALAVRALDLKPDMWVKEGVLSLLLSCVQMDE
jgi:SWI/SNF chromatin-remodeling complex subunit SWI1